MTNKYNYLSDLHFEHRQWSSELLFWKDELQIFEKELARVVQEQTDNSVLSLVEHFQNAFIVQLGGIQKLEQSIREHEKQLVHMIDVHPENVEEKYFEDHDELREGIFTQRKLIRGLRKEYFLFLSKDLQTA